MDKSEKITKNEIDLKEIYSQRAAKNNNQQFQNKKMFENEIEDDKYSKIKLIEKNLMKLGLEKNSVIFKNIKY